MTYRPTQQPDSNVILAKYGYGHGLADIESC